MTTQTTVDDADSIQRCDGLWYSDGNIVIIASDGDKKSVAFRLHRSLLAQRSPVWDTMFGLEPPESSAREYIDGVEVIRFPDNAEDLKAYLDLVYFRRYASHALQ